MNLKLRIVIAVLFFSVLIAFIKYMHVTRPAIPDTQPQALALKFLPSQTTGCVYFDIQSARKQPSLTPVLTKFESFAEKFEKFFSGPQNPYGAELQCALIAFFYEHEHFESCWFLFTKNILDEKKTIQELAFRKIAITTRNRRDTNIYTAEDTESGQIVSFFFLSPKVIVISENYLSLYKSVDAGMAELSYFDTHAGTELKHAINKDKITSAAVFSLTDSARELLMREPRFSAFSSVNTLRLDVSISKFFDGTLRVFCANPAGAESSQKIVKEFISFADALKSVYPALSYVDKMKTALSGSSFSLSLWLTEDDTAQLIQTAADILSQKTSEKQQKNLEPESLPVYNTDTDESKITGD